VQQLKKIDYIGEYDMTIKPDLLQHSKCYVPIMVTLEENVKINGPKVCYIGDSIMLTCDDVYRFSEYLAIRFTDMCVCGNLVVIFGERSPFLAMAMISVMRAGLTFSIMDPSYPTANILKKIDYVGANIYLTCENKEIVSGDILSKFKTGLNIAEEYQKYMSTKDESTLLHNKGIDDTANLMYVSFTSGTTGIPKAIWGNYNPVAHFLQWQIKTFAIGAHDKISVLGGLAHDPILRDIFLPLEAGATGYFPNEKLYYRPGKLFEWLRDNEITVVHATPSICELIFTLPDNVVDNALPALRVVFLGGEKLHSNLVRKVFKFAPNVTIVNCYGATETPQVMSYFVVTIENIGIREGYVPIGKGIDDVQLLVLTDGMALCDIEEKGQIYIRTPYRAVKVETINMEEHDCYCKNPFAEQKDDLLYKTGDIGFYDKEYNVNILGRADRQMKIRGFRIDLNEVEKEIATVVYVENVVVDIDEAGASSNIVAFIMLKKDVVVKKEKIKADLKDIMPLYMVPEKIEVVNEFPRTANGKVDVALLKKKNLTNSQGIIKNKMLLLLADVGIRFEGDRVATEIDSLKAIELACKIQNEYSVEINVALLMASKTVNDFVAIEAMVTRKKIGAGELQPQKNEKYLIEKKGTIFPKNENLLRGIFNRLLQVVSRVAPDVVRVKCHKMRGVKIGRNVSIGYDSIIETSYPYLVQIKDNVNVGMRVLIIGHFRGQNRSLGKPTVVIEDYAFVGPGVIILPNVTIGRGAVVAAGSIVNSSIPEKAFAIGNPAKVVAICDVALSGMATYDDFLKGIKPV